MQLGSPFNLIVPLDGSDCSEAALSVAEALAGSDGSICLLHVIEPVDDRQRLASGERASSTEAEQRMQHAHHALLETAARWGGTSPRMRVRVRRGEPADEILKEAEESGATMIVMASHGRGALGRWRFGSVTDRVVRATSVPVLVTRPDIPSAFDNAARLERIVMTYDGSPLAAQALPAVSLLATRLQLPVRIVRVVDVGRALAGSPLDLPLLPEVYDEIEAELRHVAQQSVDEIAASLRAGEIAAEGVVFFGPVSQTILDIVRPGDLVVMTSHGRGGIGRWVLGSVAEKLIRLAEAPVVLVPNLDRQVGV